MIQMIDVLLRAVQQVITVNINSIPTNDSVNHAKNACRRLDGLSTTMKLRDIVLVGYMQ